MFFIFRSHILLESVFLFCNFQGYEMILSAGTIFLKNIGPIIFRREILHQICSEC